MFLLRLRVLAILFSFEIASFLLLPPLDLLTRTVVLRAALLLFLSPAELCLLSGMLRLELRALGGLTRREITELRIRLLFFPQSTKEA